MQTRMIGQHTVHIHDNGDKQRRRENLTRAASRFMRAIK